MMKERRFASGSSRRRLTAMSGIGADSSEAGAFGSRAMFQRPRDLAQVKNCSFERNSSRGSRSGRSRSLFRKR
jgi:hypothetical protein